MSIQKLPKEVRFTVKVNHGNIYWVVKSCYDFIRKRNSKANIR